MSMKRHVREILLLSVFLIGAFGIGITSVVLNGKTSARNTTAAEASEVCKCTDDDVCYPDGCSRKPKSDNNTFDEARYDDVCKQFDPGYRMPEPLFQHYCAVRQPDCCFDIYKYKESRLCCWQERYVCHPSLCEGSSGGDGCGKYWGVPRDDWNDYGCVKRDSNNRDEIIPKYGVAPGLPGGGGGTNPTATPQPTSIPQNTATPQPATATATPAPNQQTTSTPVPNPTQTNNNSQSGITRFPIVPPTATPTRILSNNTDNSLNRPSGDQNNTDSSNNTNSDQNSNSVALPGINLPDFQFGIPKIQLKAPNQMLRETIDSEKIEQLNRITDPPLVAAETTLVTIKSYDQQLENTVESWIFYIRDKILRFL